MIYKAGTRVRITDPWSMLTGCEGHLLEDWDDESGERASIETDHDGSIDKSKENFEVIE